MHKAKPRPRGRAGVLMAGYGSVADVEGAQAVAVGGAHAARHIAAVVRIAAADESDAEAGSELMVMKAAAPAATPSTLGRSRRGGQRHGTERGGGNECNCEFAKHGRSPDDARFARG